MASEKPKQGDNLANPTSPLGRNGQLGIFDQTHASMDFTITFDDLFPPFPFSQIGDMHGMPQCDAQEMSLPAIRIMNDISQLDFCDHSVVDRDNFSGPVPDMSHPKWNLNELDECLPYHTVVDAASKMSAVTCTNDLENSIRSDVARDSEMSRRGGEANLSDIHRHLLIGNPRSYGDGIPMLTHNPPSSKMETNNNVMASAAHSTYPQTLDGSSLKLGVGSNTQTRHTSNVSRTDSIVKINRDVIPQPNPLCGQKADRSSLYIPKAEGKFSSIQNSVAAYNNAMQYDHGFSDIALNVDRFSGVEQNDGVSHQVHNVIEFSNLLRNDGGFSHQALNVDEFSSLLLNSRQFPRLSQNEASGTSSHVVDSQQYQCIPSNLNLGLGLNGNVRFPDENDGMGFPTESLIPHNSNEVSITGYGQVAAGMLPSSSFFRGATQSSFDQLQNLQSGFEQLQNLHTGTFRNFPSNPSLVAPFVGDIGSISRQGQAAGHTVQANKVTAAEVGLFSKNIEAQPANKDNPSHSQATVRLQPSKSFYGSACTAGQEIPAGNAPTQASVVPCRPSRKRGATEFPLASSQAGRTKIQNTRSSGHPSTPNVTQIAQSLLAQSPPLSPPPVQPACSLLTQSPLNVAQTTTPHAPLVPIPPMYSKPFQTAHTNLSQSVPNVAQLAPTHAPLARTSPSLPLVHTARPQVAQLAQSVARAAPSAPLALTPLSSPAPVRHLAQKARFRSSLAKTTSVQPSLVSNAPRIPPLPSSIATDRIKWQESDNTLQLSGHQCPLCKRDLSFTPAGEVSQPADPPPVAVLPCRHHFHALCLERITTDAGNPPCIPCALGDKN